MFVLMPNSAERTAPQMVDVKVERDTDDHGTGRKDLWCVCPVWADVDLPDGFGWLIRGERLARRLEAALRAGATLRKAEVRTNLNGQTYVADEHRVMGRTMNADLRRLGF